MKLPKAISLTTFGLLFCLLLAQANPIATMYLPYMAKPIPTPTPTIAPTPTPIPSPTATIVPTPTSTPVPSTTGDVRITYIFFDGSGSQEPNEYVEIRNYDAHPIQLSGWVLKDIANHRFTFPSYQIQPNETCRIYTNQNDPDTCGFSYRNGSAIWNNSGDTATLTNSAGVVIDTCSYSGSGTGSSC